MGRSDKAWNATLSRRASLLIDQSTISIAIVTGSRYSKLRQSIGGRGSQVIFPSIYRGLLQQPGRDSISICPEDDA